jgi:hypothetical protein
LHQGRKLSCPVLGPKQRHNRHSPSSADNFPISRESDPEVVVTTPSTALDEYVAQVDIR